MKTLASYLLTLALCLSASARADDASVRAAIAKRLPGVAIDSVAATPVKGLTAVTLGTQVVYVSNDGEYLLGGPLIKVVDGANLSEVRVAAARRKLLAESDDVRRFHYPAADARHRVTIFTDIDCPYCRRMHQDLPGFAAAGIDVAYVMLPRAGKGSASYTKTVNAACATDPEAAITAAMGGATPPEASCDHPIDTHLALARKLGIGSTPSIVLESGELVLGQRKAEDLLSLLESRQ